MEMDEIITQIQQWRKSLTSTEVIENAEGTMPRTEYHSEAYDRLFGANQDPDAPECVEENSPTPFQHIADIDMVAKVKMTSFLELMHYCGYWI